MNDSKTTTIAAIALITQSQNNSAFAKYDKIPILLQDLGEAVQVYFLVGLKAISSASK